jgi:hypothetical protein
LEVALTVAPDHVQRELEEFAAFGQVVVVIGFHVLLRPVFKGKHLSALVRGLLYQCVKWLGQADLVRGSGAAGVKLPIPRATTTLD